ncbi:MAG: bifunctional 5,10-methylenetetrahydrofolate dehydrogenase/5,10-methenyltetrahydrofolate cyclohydrolase [Dehalococcoidia bacterium]
MDSKIIDGKLISTQILEEVKLGVVDLENSSGLVPGLTVILVGEDPASKVYVGSKERKAGEVGMKGQTINLSSESSERDLIQVIEALNEDDSCHGILVQLPLPNHIDENRIISCINPLKDVDGLHPYNVGLLASGSPRFVPATPGGIKEMMIRSDITLRGKHVVVIGRSNIVGRPVSNLLSLKGEGGDATVTICHSQTRNLIEICQSADVIIAAIGIPNYITGGMVSEGVVAIDVGINRIEDSQRRRGYKLVGDIEFDTVAEKSVAITPVPGGVGPMTIAMLLSNTLLAAKLSS